LRHVTAQHPDLLVGTETADDAAVWRLSADRALVATVDFITPVVDDARAWGRAAAVNSVSDVYAMGGKPLFALNVLCWNATELPAELLGQVLDGAAEVAAECGFVIVGGHTVDDPEPKFGLSVVGEAHPDRLLRNSGLRPGDRLILTKAIGTGVISTAAKAGVASREAIDAMLASMFRTNEEAAQVALDCGAEGATDVTGFGLVGHLAQMALSSGVDVTVDVGSVPLLSGARELAAAGHVPEGSRRNLEWTGERVDRGAADATTVLLLADAQTSGGLLLGVDPGRAPDALARLSASGHACAEIGRAEPGRGILRLR
jgi:selenide,water dikinase